MACSGENSEGSANDAPPATANNGDFAEILRGGSMNPTPASEA